MLSFFGLVMGVFKTDLTKILKCFFKGNVWFKGGLDHFHKTTPTQTKRMFGYWGLFVRLMGM